MPPTTWSSMRIGMAAYAVIPAARARARLSTTRPGSNDSMNGPSPARQRRKADAIVGPVVANQAARAGRTWARRVVAYDSPSGPSRP